MKLLPGLLLSALALVLVTVLSAPGQPVQEPTAALPANVLGPAYVDLRNGFSIRSPLAYSLGSTPSKNWPDLIDWSQLKLPASKRLVSFRHPDGEQRLTVYLLVTRQEMTIESILEARQSYWQTFPDQATLQESTTETVSSFPAAVTHLLWKGKGQDRQVRVRETLIQREKNRYFMLVQVGALPEAKGDAGVFFDEAIADNFVCMEESEIKQRWSQARKAARKLLEPLDSASLKSKFGDQAFYRLRREGQEVGFYCVRRKLHVLADRKQHRFEIDTLAYANSGAAAQAYAELIGWRAGPLVPGAGKPALIGPVRLESHFQLDGSLKAERFEFRATDGQNPPNLCCEKGQWQEKGISLTPCQTGRANEEAGVEQLKITSKIEKIYLPLSLVDVLGQFIEPVVGKEYVFARYFYRTLGFYSLRVVDKVELKLERLPITTAKSEAMTEIETEQVSEQVKALYLVGQLNSQGPIIELWLDEKGQTLVQKAPGIEWVRASQAEIAQRWPKELAALLPDETKKATTK